MKDPSEEADFALSPQCAWTLEKEISWQVSDPRLMPVLPSSSDLFYRAAALSFFMCQFNQQRETRTILLGSL